MRTVVFGLNITIDGVCDHTHVIADDELHRYYTELLRGADIIVFGRKTYELMYPYWHDVARNQSETDATNEFARTIDALPKIVVSTTLKSVKWKDSRIISGDLVEEVAKLKRQPGKNISIGGLSIASQLVPLGLIDHFHFVVHPMFAGTGKRLFESGLLTGSLPLRLAGSQPFRSGAVALHYEKGAE